MTPATAAVFRTLAFGDLDAGIWGIAWLGEDPIIAVGRLEPGASATAGRAVLAGESIGEDWTVSGDDLELAASPASEPVQTSGLEGFDQLCTVRGELTLGDATHAVDALGRRGSRIGLDFSRIDSIRDVCAWFGPGDGIALTALRPRRARGQESDVVTASVFEPTGAVEVADPRLSTTYGADGAPARAGLELWLEQEDSEEQHPRRAAGEALGASAAAAPDGLTLQALPFRWHSRGADGTGVYLLARCR